MKVWAVSTRARDIRGNSQCKNGSTKREECSYECESLDAEKISASQINTGSQYLKNGRSLGTANQNRILRAGQSEYDWICQAVAHLAQKYMSMNKFLTFLFCVAMMTAVVTQATPPAPDLIARIHFAGAGQISTATNAVAFTNLWCSPEAQALREQTLNKLSRAPYDWLKQKILSSTNDGAGQLRPLLDDLLSAEWFLQIRDATNGSPEFALAIRLDAGRAQLWQTNLGNVLEAWTVMPVEKKQNGWKLKKHLPPNLIQFVRAGDWVVFGWGQDNLLLNDELVRRVLDEKRPAPAETNSWLTVDLNWPRLARWFPSINPFDLPETQWQVIGRDGNLHLDGRLIFPQPLALTLEPWRMPTNTIHQPFISFTAARGIAPWLEKQKWAQPYEISPVPNQVFIWVMSPIPLQTFAALPVPDGKQALKELAQKMSANTNWQSHFMLPLAMEVTNNRISWIGLPFIAPSLEALSEPTGDFLFAGVFPNGPKNKPLPPELFVRLAQSNLVYYHWEITAERLKLLPQLSQLSLMVTRHRQLDAQSVAGKWLERIGPTLGNTLTEVKQTAPNELSFTRNAPGGLTAVELTALANWLEATNFPGCDLRLPPPKFKRPHPKTPGKPPVTTPAASPPAPAASP
jgi:hypothetical protein